MQPRQLVIQVANEINTLCRTDQQDSYHKETAGERRQTRQIEMMKAIALIELADAIRSTKS